MFLRLLTALALALALARTAPAQPVPRTAAPAPGPAGWLGRVASALLPTGNAGGHRLSLGEALGRARAELQIYRGEHLERLSDLLTVGRSRFDPSLSVADNVKRAAEEAHLTSYLADLDGRQVLHVVVPLASGASTARAVRALQRQVGEQTIELNYKAASSTNPYGHVAVRTGGGALFDLTGTRGVAELPPLLGALLGALQGSPDLSLARRRSLRRFMESRQASDASSSVFHGLLFAATPAEIEQTEDLYRRRQGQVKAFAVGGGEASKGVFSCAQFLTEGVPFLNQRGIGASVSARATASAARRSPQLEAVLVYQPPGAATEGRDL